MIEELPEFLTDFFNTLNKAQKTELLKLLVSGEQVEFAMAKYILDELEFEN